MTQFKLLMACILVAPFAFAQSSSEAPANTSMSNLPQAKQKFKNQALSVYNYTPAAETSRIVISPIVRTSDYKSTSNRSGRDYSHSSSSSLLGLEFNRAFNGFSLSASTDIGNDQSTQKYWETESESFKKGGFSDFVFAFKGIQASGSQGRLIYGSELSVSPAKKKYATSTSNGNRYSGGASISPFAGFESQTSFGTAGANLMYSLMGERTGEGTQQTDKTTGGNVLSLSAFSESRLASGQIGGALAWQSRESQDITESVVGYQDDKYLTDAESYLKASLYGKFEVLPDIEFLPSLSYNTLLTKDINNQKISKSENLNLNLNFSTEF